MRNFFLKWFIAVVGLLIIVNLLPGIEVDRWETLAVAAFVLGFVNAFLRPLLLILTLPINILTLGLFTLIINALMLYLASKIVKGFFIADFWNAFLGALCYSGVNFFLSLFIKPRKRAKHYHSNVIDVEAKQGDNNV